MKSRRFAFLFSIGAACLVACVAFAQNQDSPGLNVRSTNDGSVITFTHQDRELAIHQTSSAISNPKLVEVPGTSALIATWNEAAETSTFYSVSVDGERFSDPRPATNRIMLRYAGSEGFDPLESVPQIPQSLQSRFNRNGGPTNATDTSLYIVQYIAPPTDVIAQPVIELGATPRAFLFENAHIVEMTQATSQHVAALPIVRWVGPFHEVYRLEEELIDEMSGDIVRMPTRRYSIMLFERGPGAQQAVADRIAGLGGIVNARIPEGFRLEATLTPQQLVEIAGMNQVQFIDRWGPAGTDMNIARQIGGATPLLSGFGFTGQGVRGEVMDGGLRQTHQAFLNPPPLIHGQNPSISAHGTNTYGIVFSTGAGNVNGIGLLPDREQGIFATYNQLTSQGGTVSRYTHTSELVNPLGPYRAVFQSNSWGSPLTTQYTTMSAEFDDIAFINDILICQSQSNNGNTSSRPQAWSKNVVSVGGVTHQNTLSRTDDMWTAASHGYAADGRIKPDLAHFYDDVTTPTSSSNTAYTSIFGGTSAATPIVCGYFGLLFQMWHEQVFDGHGGNLNVFQSRPHMSTAKALMINSAFRYNWLSGGANATITRQKQGWGMPDLAKLYNDRAKLFIIDETDPIAPFGVNSYQVQVPAGEPEFRATMAYTDPKGNPGSPVARINDLSMKVTAPDGTIYWGNNGLHNSNVSQPGGSPNTVDTVENVFINNPMPGTWTIEIFGDAIVQDARVETPAIDADYALVVAGGTPIELCPQDVTGDGVINVSDLLAIINAWGPCAGCAADINDDGQVNVIDLLSVINSWGACP